MARTPPPPASVTHRNVLQDPPPPKLRYVILERPLTQSGWVLYCPLSKSGV